jgi:copper homeostasis protein
MTPRSSLVIEVCVGTVDSALAAQEGGANRVELCDNLLEGGTTPSAGAIALARKHLSIDMNVIIRPRGGDFYYSDLEFAIMQHDIEVAKQHGANGVVIGLLTADGDIDVERTRALVEQARPLSVTFHRAFDMTRDPFAALETLIDLGIDRVLTTGQEDSVIEGLDLVAELVERAAGRIIVMPGGGNERNMAKIVERTGAKEVHVTGTTVLDSPMRFRRTHVFMSGGLHVPEYSREITDPARIRQIRG